MNATGLLFGVDDAVLTRPGESVPSPVVSRSEQDLTRWPGWRCGVRCWTD